MPGESFSFVSISGSRSSGGSSVPAGTADNNLQKITGEIEFTTSTYKVTVVNKYSTIDVKLKKEDKQEHLLSGATFDLMKKNEAGAFEAIRQGIAPGGSVTVLNSETNAEEVIPLGNPIDLGQLAVGQYQLTETKSPDGYIILTKDVYFEVYKGGDGALQARLTDAAGVYIESMTDVGTELTGTDDSLVFTITVKNEPGVALPNTGAVGDALYLLGGLSLLSMALLSYIGQKRRPAHGKRARAYR